MQGGLYNALMRSLQQLGLADAFGDSDIPLLVLNVTYPLVPEQVADFCVGKRAVLVVEEGQPEYIEQEIATLLRRRDIQTPLHGKDLLPAAGEYSVEVLVAGPARSSRSQLPARAQARDSAKRHGWPATATAAKPSRPSSTSRCPTARRASASAAPSGRCSRRSSWRSRTVGPVHIAADIGCHAFGTFEPFSMGHSILGYGMSLASRAGVSPMMQRRTLSIMGDGGFWHNGLLTGVQSALFNGDDAVLLIFKNGYTRPPARRTSSPRPSDDTKVARSDKRRA